MRDLRLVSQAHRGVSRLYGFDVCYQDVNRINGRRAKRMAKTLALLEKRMSVDMEGESIPCGLRENVQSFVRALQPTLGRENWTLIVTSDGNKLGEHHLAQIGVLDLVERELLALCAA